MTFAPKFISLRKFVATCALSLGLLFCYSQAMSQTGSEPQDIDPRLAEIVHIIKSRVEIGSTKETTPPNDLAKDETYLNLLDRMEMAAYSGKAEEISLAVADFENVYANDAALDISRIHELYISYAKLISADASSLEIQNHLSDFTTRGNWFERYEAFSLSARIHGRELERQAALQKAQLALALIPTKPNPQNESYVIYAKTKTIALIAYLHNLQGHSDLALTTSLEYLNLTQDNPDLNVDVDLLNNLIYGYARGRDHASQLYLSEQLLEIEKIQSASLLGLSEMRISNVMNSVANFQEGLRFAESSLSVATHPTVIRNSRISKSMSLVGLGRIKEARVVADLAGVNLSQQHMLNVETRKSDLYLAFLLAQTEDIKYATKLYNRQLDVTAQNFLANNSRDTTAMLADLENSRERQVEREEASAREAELQALTIDRQRNLNRLLILLTFILSGAALGSFLFMKSREKLLRELEIKTVEAASAEKLKTEFLGMISHELRTPLNGIIGISDFLANYHEDPDIRKKTSIVLRSGNELLSVVESLTDMARLDAGQLALAPHDADLSLSLSAVPKPWEVKAEQKGLVFTHFIDPAIGHHAVDEDRLVQCLNILLANAVSFTDAGRVHMHITGQVNAENDVTGLTAIVADTGQGMTELVQSRLFTPFMQADTSRKRTHMGTGLSLAIAYALAEMMGGCLSVMSREGRGSEFKLEVPLAAATGEIQNVTDSHTYDMTEISGNLPTSLEVKLFEDKPVFEPPVLDRADAPQREFVDLMKPRAGFPSLHDVDELVLPTPTGGRQRILVVDDVDSNRDILRLILESQGHICGEAADGFAALDLLARQSFDLIVLDIHMAPLDGVGMLRRLRASGMPYANIPVVALTADNAASTNAACMEAGADLFLTKPVKQEELLRALSYLHQAEDARILSQ